MAESSYFGRLAARLRTSADQPTSDRVQADTHLLGDSILRHPLLTELDHLLIASQAVLLIGREPLFRRARTPRVSCLLPSRGLFFKRDFDLAFT